MKQIFPNSILLILAISISMAFAPTDEKGKVHLKVTKEENGEQKVFEKVYESMDELKADKELKQFDVLLEDWANKKDKRVELFQNEKPDGEKTIIIRKKMDGKDEMTWTSDDKEELKEGDNLIIIQQKDGDEDTIIYNSKKVVKIKSKDGDDHVTIKMEGDDDQKMIWIDENGSKTELTDEKIEKMISEVEVTTSGGDKETVDVIIMEGDDNRKTEVEVEVKKEIDALGEEKIIEKKVWVTKDGKKIELDDDDAYEIKTEGDTFTIKVDRESMDSEDFSDEKFDGDNVMVYRNKAEGEPGMNQMMNINIDEKNGEQFIKIDIKRSNSVKVMISEILQDDASLSDIDYSLKNNLKPSKLNYFPNPNNGRFTLDFTLDQKEEVTVVVMDILGKEVYKEKLLDFQGNYDNQIDLSGKEKGIYILQISQKKKMLTRKILIE